MDFIPVAHIRAVQTAISLTTITWVEVKVGSTKLDSRKWVQIFNRSPYKIFYSYDNTADVRYCFALRAGGMVILPLSDCVPIYVKGTHTIQRVIIAEVA